MRIRGRLAPKMKAQIGPKTGKFIQRAWFLKEQSFIKLRTEAGKS